MEETDDDNTFINEIENLTLQSESNHVFENKDDEDASQSIPGIPSMENVTTERISHEKSTSRGDYFFMSEDENKEPDIPIVECDYDKQSRSDIKMTEVYHTNVGNKDNHENSGANAKSKDVDDLSLKSRISTEKNQSNLTRNYMHDLKLKMLTRNRLKLVKKMEKMSVNLKVPSVVLERLDIRPSYSAPEILKKKKRTSKDETPLIKRFPIQLRFPINEENEPSIEIPIDERPLVTEENSKILEDEAPLIEMPVALRLPINEENEPLIVEEIEVPIAESPLTTDEDSEISEDEIPPIERPPANLRPQINEDNDNWMLENIEIPSGALIMDDNANRLVSRILHWDPSVFMETWVRGKEVPEILQKYGADKMSQSYESYEVYRKKLLNQLTLDVGYKIVHALNDGDLIASLQEVELVESTATKIMLSGTYSYFLEFEIRINISNESSLQIPTIGNLLCLKIFNINFNLPTIIFAYVKNVTIFTMHNNRVEISCNLVSKWLNLNHYKNEFQELRILMSLLNSLNLVQSVTDFESSPLLSLILKPEEKTYKLPISEKQLLKESRNCSDEQFITLEDHMKSTQFHSVFKIINTIIRKEPKVCLIEGPPGSGKTKTIIDIICSVLKSKVSHNRPQKMLISSQSKTVVKEILRLSTELGSKENIRIVQIDQPETDPQLKEFSLSILAERRVVFEINEFVLSQKVGNREEVNSPHELKPDDNAIKKHIFESCFEIQKSGKSVLKMDKVDFSKLLRVVEKEILLDANILLCTLSTCHSERMNFFRENEGISVCIIDDATNIPEIEILKPLTFGAKCLILLGDPFLSQYDLITQGLNNSLFSRIKVNLKEVKNSPIIKFDFQFRLNETLMICLNKILFSGGVKSCLKKNTFPVRPFTVLNPMKEDYTEITQDDEALFVANLITSIIEFANWTYVTIPVRIGIIVPYATQKPALISAINVSLWNIAPEKTKYFSIEVDTIDAFKNQERDVIIVSCTKRNRKDRPVSDEWFYCAITRSKHSLILYGSLKPKKPCLLQCVIENLVYSQDIQINFIAHTSNPLMLKDFIMRC